MNEYNLLFISILAMRLHPRDCPEEFFYNDKRMFQTVVRVAEVARMASQYLVKED